MITRTIQRQLRLPWKLLAGGFLDGGFGEEGAPPVFVGLVPADRLGQAGFEGDSWLPAQLAPDL